MRHHISFTRHRTYELKAIGLINENTDTDDLVKRSFKKFDGVPDSYEADGDSFNAVQG